MSAAGTGFFYTMRRPRIRDKMILRKYDPIGKHWSINCIAKKLNFEFQAQGYV